MEAGLYKWIFLASSLKILADYKFMTVCQIDIINHSALLILYIAFITTTTITIFISAANIHTSHPLLLLNNKHSIFQYTSFSYEQFSLDKGTINQQMTEMAHGKRNVSHLLIYKRNAKIDAIALLSFGSKS